MKAKMLIVMMCLMFGAVGCDEIKPEQVQNLATQVQELNTAMDSYQTATTEMLETMYEHRIIDESAVKKVEKVSEEIDRVQPQVADMVAAIMAANQSGDDAANWIAILQAANQATTPFNPYVLPISLGLTLASLVFGFVEKRNADKNQLKYQAHKQGAEKTSIELESKEKLLLYSNIGDARNTLGVK